MDNILRFYCYGNPNAVENLSDLDWTYWRRFVNQGVNPADEHEGFTLYTDWDNRATASEGTASLYGYVIRSGDLIPNPEEIDFSKAEDWRIETHMWLLPLARNIIKREDWRHEQLKNKWQELGKILGLAG
jgi:hypothetical protein